VKKSHASRIAATTAPTAGCRRSLAASPAPKEKRGLRGAVIANKKEELTDYMQQAVALGSSFLPARP
jgi:hypothetical protein